MHSTTNSRPSGSVRRAVALAVAVVALVSATLVAAPGASAQEPEPLGGGGGRDVFEAAVVNPDYRPLDPARLADTRPGKTTVDGVAAGTGLVGPTTPLVLTVGGRGGVPSSGVAAVALNVTAIGTQGSGFVTAYPSGESRPTASNINFSVGQTVANSVIAKLGANKVVIYSSIATHISVDVSGYFSSGGITPLSPARLADTRPQGVTVDGVLARTGPVRNNAPMQLQVTGRGGVAGSGVTAVALNITAVAPSNSGYLTAYPSGSARPGASTVNYRAGQTVANSSVAKVGTGGKVAIFNSGSPVDVVVDVAGYFTSSAKYVPIEPRRFADTRPSGAAVSGPSYLPNYDSANLGPIGTSGFNGPQLDVLIAGRGGVPSKNIGAVVLNVTVTQPQGAGHVTVFPLDGVAPVASSLNFGGGQTVANMVVAKIGRGGGVSLSTPAPGVEMIVDVVGYFPSVDMSDIPATWSSLLRDDAGMPMSYDRCAKLYYRINPTGARTGWLADINSAIAQIETATGLDLVNAGNTTEAPSTSRGAFDSNGSPKPLLIAFPNATTIPSLGGSVVGIGGSSSSFRYNYVRYIPEQFFSGLAYFDKDEDLPAGFVANNAFGKVAIHELGHVLGLGHIDNINEIMNPYIGNAQAFAAGDRLGLGLLYKTQSCPGSPASFSAASSAPGKPQPDLDGAEIRTRTVLEADHGDHDSH